MMHCMCDAFSSNQAVRQGGPPRCWGRRFRMPRGGGLGLPPQISAPRPSASTSEPEPEPAPAAALPQLPPPPVETPEELLALLSSTCF